MKVVVVNMLVLCALLACIEVALRIKYPDYGFYARTQPGEMADRAFGARRWPRKDAELGWVLTQGVADFYKPEGVQPPEYHANGAGFRDAREFHLTAADSGWSRVMMLGDSFLFAVHLNADDAIPRVLESALPHTEVFNVGIPGWGLDQMYLAYEKYEDSLRPQVVVLTYIDDDIKRVYEAYRLGEGMNKPSFDVVNGALVPRTRATPLSPVLRAVLDHSVLANKLYVLYTYVEMRRISEALFAALAAETRRHGQQLAVVRIPSRYDLPARHFPDKWSFDDFFRKSGIHFVDPLPAMANETDLYIPGDEHLTAKGTRLVAGFLSRNIDISGAH